MHNLASNALLFPNGNFAVEFKIFKVNIPEREHASFMKYSAKSIGELIKKTRKAASITQKSLALTSGTGLRFIIELEKGKETSQIGKVLTVLNTLGIQINFTPPKTAVSNEPNKNARATSQI